MKSSSFCLRLVVAAWVASQCGCASANLKSVRCNFECVQRYFVEWANHGDAAVADDLLATNLVFHSPSATLYGRSEYKARLLAFHAAFPDLHYSVDDCVATADKVAVRWTLRASQAIPYQGHEPNGKTMTVTGITLFGFANGRIRDIWVNMDRLGQMEQLGWMPMPAIAK